MVKTNFYCSNGNKCSTEQIVREYYKNNGYQVMRAEYSFWKGIFVLTFLDELYPQTLNVKTENKFFDLENKNVTSEESNQTINLVNKSNIQTSHCKYTPSY